ncbi:MAG: RNA methyltransferase [Candidatus Contendobacter sp.]|nr:RNA methyltransferase [Candidatus Contendobacter sp.]MDG4558176.1 RNA methyltransferase [Candidatus Contendobacter sp.]
MFGESKSHEARADTPEILAHSRALQASRKLRDAQRVFFIEGIRNFLSALDHEWEIESTLYSERLLKSGIARSKIRSLARQGIPTFKLSPEEFRSISTTQQASGVAALVKQRTWPLEYDGLTRGPLWLVVQSLQSNGNLGSLLRTSMAVGGCGLIVVGEEVDPFNPDLIRASMGSFFAQKIIATTMPKLKTQCRKHSLQIVGACPKALSTHFGFKFEHPSLIVLGNERSGLSPELRDLCTDFVYIPMAENIDSLNVSVAGSILMYEAMRCALQAESRKRHP